MRNVLIYDAPTRVFHWLFAGFFAAAFAIANLVDDESARFSLHMLAGLCMVFVLLLRIVWSLVGTRHARASDLVLNPARLFGYFRDMVSGRGKEWAGHNPASSWAAVTMASLALGLGITGTLMATGGENGSAQGTCTSCWPTASWRWSCSTSAACWCMHLRHRDRLPSSMLTGRKQAARRRTRADPFAAARRPGLPCLDRAVHRPSRADL
jgi:cytochrome b